MSSPSETNRNREHIFLGSSNPSMPNQVFLHDSISPSFIKLPFPPCIDPYKLISDRKQDKSNSIGRIPARTPNAFILYRKIFIESARKEGYQLPMTVISSMASKYWKHEPDIVKNEYKRISKQAFEIRKQLLPKSERKKKREKWNFVSFSKKSNLNDNSNKIEMKISGNYKDIQQKDLDENFDSLNSSLKMTNLFPSDESSSNNTVDDENVPYKKEELTNSNYQMYDQKPANYTNLVHNSYISHNDNENIGFDELSYSNAKNIYDINQHQLNNNDDAYANSTVDSDISLMQNSHYNFQTYYI